MGNEGLILEKGEGVATITLNKPDKLNAISLEMTKDLLSVLEDISRDRAIRAWVLTGAGRGFCSGADLSEPLRLVEPENKQSSSIWLANMNAAVMLMHRMDKPSIAAVNGIAVGAGLSLALACDIRIASDAARFGTIFVKRGFMPDAGCTYFMPRLVGSGHAAELLFAGDIIESAEAERIGLVNRVMPAAELLGAAKELATRIAKGPPIPIKFIKKGIYRALDSALESQLEFETTAAILCRSTEDYNEGMQAFMEKREPIFKGI